MSDTREAKHTEGPWRSVQAPTISGDSRFIYSGDDPEHIAAIPWLDREEEERYANARLIASAPALLAALEACHHALGMINDFGTATNENPDIQNRALDAARAAIAAARGGE